MGVSLSPPPSCREFCGLLPAGQLFAEGPHHGASWNRCQAGAGIRTLGRATRVPHRTDSSGTQGTTTVTCASP
jgi:hypothetical protein